VRGGINREKLYLHSNTTLEGFLSSIGFSAADIAAYGDVVGAGDLSTFGHPAINFTNTFTTFANGNRNTTRNENVNLVTLGDTLTWIKDRHAFRIGGDLVRNGAVDDFATNRNNVRGLMTYSGKGTNPFTAFLLGLPATSVASVIQPRPSMDVHNWEHGYFIQDSWKVSSRLTVNLGLRNPAAFGPPSVGADVFSNAQVAKRNMLWGPGTWGVNLGVHKDFHATERVVFQFGADVDNLFNHPLFSPNAGGGGGSFALLGDFNIRVDAAGKLIPIDPAINVTPNPDFGRLINSFSQEGIDSWRTIRLRLRITF
jgi:hypothetical protein